MRTLHLILGCLVTTACVKTPGMELRERVETVERAHDPERLLRQARAFASIGDFTRAEQYYNLAIQGGGDETEILPFLVQACIRDQRYRDAIQYLENALRRQPEKHALRFVLATLEIGIGDIERARTELEKVLSAKPNHAEAHYALAVVFRDDLGSLSSADRHFREYLRLRPSGRHAEEARGSLLEVVP